MNRLFTEHSSTFLVTSQGDRNASTLKDGWRLSRYRLLPNRLITTVRDLVEESRDGRVDVQKRRLLTARWTTNNKNITTGYLAQAPDCLPPGKFEGLETFSSPQSLHGQSVHLTRRMRKRNDKVARAERHRPPLDKVTSGPLLSQTLAFNGVDPRCRSGAAPNPIAKFCHRWGP